MKIGIDVDGVLCRTVEYFLFDFNKQHNTKFSRDDIKEVEFIVLEGFDGDYILDKLVEHIDGNMSFYDITDHSKKVLKKLKEQGHELIVITARMNHFKDKTVEWLEYHFGKDFFDDIVFYNHSSKERIPKYKVCNDMAVELLIDDSPDNAIGANKHGINVLVMSNPWNEHLEDTNMLKRVNNWKDVLEHLSFYEMHSMLKKR